MEPPLSVTASPRDDALPAWIGPVLFGALLVVGLLSLLSLRPSAPRAASAPDSAFSAERARVHLERIAGEPRPVGASAHADVREYLVGALRELGLDARVDSAAWVPTSYSWVRAIGVRNVVARLPGSDPTGTVALVSHYDSRIGAPGAGDAGTAVAAILETVRALREGPSLRNDLVVLITDGEELGLVGARVFLEADTTADSVTVALNFEGRGSRGPALMFETGTGNGPLVRLFADVDPRPIGSSLYPEAYAYLPNITDFTLFTRAGRTGLNFAHAAGADAYHMPFDVPARVPDATLQHHGEHAVSLARALGDAELRSIRGDDVTYFNLPGAGLVVYPMSWVLPLALLSLVLMLGLLVWGIRRGVVTLGGAAAGAGATLPVAGLAALTGWGIWRMAAAVHSEAGTLIGQRLYGERLYMAAVLLAGAALGFGAYQVLRRWFNVPSLALGAHALLVAVGLAAALSAPGAAYLLTWPALFGLAATAYLIRGGGKSRAASRPEEPPRRGTRWGGLAALTALAIPPTLIVAPHYPLFLVGLSIMFGALFAPLALIAVVPVLPLLPALSRPNRWWLPATLGGAAILFVGVGLLRAGVSDERPAAANLVYLMDRDTAEAHWATAHPAGDPWLDEFVGADSDSLQIQDYVPLRGQRMYRVAPADVADVPATEVGTARVAGDPGRIRLEVTPPAGALGLIVTPADTGWVPVSLEGERLLPHTRFWRIELWATPPDGVWSIELLALYDDPAPDVATLVTVRAGLPPRDGEPVIRPADRTGTSLLDSRPAFTDLTIVRETVRP